MTFEAKMIYFLQSGISEGWTVFFRTVSLFGSVLGALILLGIFLIFDKRLAIVFGLTYGFGVGLNEILKKIFMRLRPFEAYDSIQGLIDVSGSSMPSAHAVSVTIIAVFSVVGVILLTRKKFTKIATLITMLMFVGIVCLSRMYLGVHYLTDLVAGVVIGLLVSMLGIFIDMKLLAIKIQGGKDD